MGRGKPNQDSPLQVPKGSYLLFGLRSCQLNNHIIIHHFCVWCRDIFKWVSRWTQLSRNHHKDKILTRNTPVEVSRRIKNQDNPETSIYNDYTIHQSICRIVGVFLHRYLWLAILVMFGHCYKSPWESASRQENFSWLSWELEGSVGRSNSLHGSKETETRQRPHSTEVLLPPIFSHLDPTSPLGWYSPPHLERVFPQ